MRKKVFRIVALAGIMAVTAVGFAGCKKTECYLCGEMKRCKPFDDYVLGELNLCKDCREAIEPLSKNLREYLE
ncbi:MAG: hypothetical protein PUC30_06840 [Lachnospiraceae bacterium]|nr:hypothetical protein [Lachnospiraceae bacterium]